MSRTFSAIITEEDEGFVALNPDTDVASQGDTIDDALANLKEALELYFEETTTQNQVDGMPHATFLTTVTIQYLMPISGKRAIKILQDEGFVIARQRGSHVVLTKQSNKVKLTTVVPLHKELKKGTIRSIAKLAGMQPKDFGL